MDLVIVLNLLLFCAIVVFQLGKRFGAQHPFAGQLLLASGIALAAWLAWTSAYSLSWALWIPYSFVLVLANASVILIVGSAGLIVGTHCLERNGRGMWKARLVVLSLWATAVCFTTGCLLRPAWQPLELSRTTTWSEGVCLQSHPSTCAPAAVATLLRLHGIATNENEMSRACLTSRNGTLALGTFRGVCLGAQGFSYSPRALVCEPATVTAEELDDRLPMLAHVNFSQDASRSARLASIARDDGHAVVLLEQLADGSWLVADPAVGRVIWGDEYFRNAWVGEGIYLVTNERSAAAN